MNFNQMNLALKMIKEEYRLTEAQMETLQRRLMADEREFDKMWNVFKSRRPGKVDVFIETLRELLAS